MNTVAGKCRPQCRPSRSSLDLGSQTIEPARSEGPIETINLVAIRIKKVRKRERTSVTTKELLEEALPKANEIARAELIRGRARLGDLTREQETAVENLLIATVARVSRLAKSVLESWPSIH